MIEELVRLVPPPSQPTYCVSDAVLKSKFGFTFPRDLIAISKAYGSGRFFSDSFDIPNPKDPTYNEWVDFELSVLRKEKEVDAHAVPFDIFPDKGGLFPFGR